MLDIMKNFRRLLPVALMMAFCACTDSFEFVADPVSGSIDSFYSEVQTYGKIESFSNENGIQIITSNSSVIDIPENAFSLNGEIVQGTIDFEYLELFDKGLMMLYGIPTTTNTDFLKSDGVFHFAASQNGEALTLAENKFINVKVVNDNPGQEIRLFFGDDDEGNFLWEEAEAFADGINTIWPSDWVVEDSTGMSIEGIGYQFIVSELTWINCDYYYNIPDELKTSVCVQLPQQLYGNTNTVVYMIDNNEDTFTTLVGDPNTKEFCEPYDLTPIGLDVTFVSITQLGNGEYRFGTESAVITEGFLTGISPEEKTLDEILDILGQF